MNKGTKRLEPMRLYVLENWENESDQDIARRFDSKRGLVADMRHRLGLMKGKKGEKDYFALHGRRFTIGYWRAFKAENVK